MLLALFILAACPMFGQTPGTASYGMGPGEVKFLGAMLGLGIAGGLCGTSR